MKTQFLLLTFCSLFVAAQPSNAATILTYNLTSGGKTLFNSDGTTPLTGGPLVNVNDGEVIQLGYYTLATAANLFAGTWTPFASSHNIGNDLAEFGTVGTGAGANPATQNRFSFGFTVDSTFANPPPGTLLAIRVYNGLTLPTSTFFQGIASTDWLSGALAEPPSNSTVTLNFANTNAKLQSTGALPGTAISTTIPTAAAPEPTSAALLMVGLVSLAARRRRAVKV